MQRRFNEGKPCFLKDNIMMINQIKINKNNAALLMPVMCAFYLTGLQKNLLTDETYL
jgi:hypothetical protein